MFCWNFGSLLHSLQESAIELHKSICRSFGAKIWYIKLNNSAMEHSRGSIFTEVHINHCGWTRWPFIFFWKACKCCMACKCFFETRKASVCSESSARMIKLSECTGDISDHLQACHIGQLRGKVQEYELIVNRSGLPHYLSPDHDQLEQFWICEKHRENMGKNWRPRRTCQYPLHSGRKKQLNTRNAVHLDMSREINTIFAQLIPTGSRKYDSYVNSSLPIRYCPEMWSTV